MGPKLLGGGASLLAAAFVLALPSIFKGEPADEVEPIRFGPPLVANLAGAVKVTEGQAQPAPDLPTPAPVAPVSAPTVASHGTGGGETPWGRSTSAEGSGDDDKSRGDDADESEDGSGNEDSDQGHGEDESDDRGESMDDDLSGDGNTDEIQGDTGRDDDDDPGGAEDDD